MAAGTPRARASTKPATFDGPGRCNTLFPNHKNPRLVAGRPIADDITKCQLKPIDARDYSVAVHGGRDCSACAASFPVASATTRSRASTRCRSAAPISSCRCHRADHRRRRRGRGNDRQGDSARGAPEGLADRPTTFATATVDVPPPADGQVLVRNLFMSVDPYMRGRMNDVKSYVPPFQVGQPLEGGAIGEVIESRAPDLKAGRHRPVDARLARLLRRTSHRPPRGRSKHHSALAHISACWACRDSPPGWGSSSSS